MELVLLLFLFTFSLKSSSHVPGVTLGPVLGRGAFGLVRLGTLFGESTNTVVAVKVILFGCHVISPLFSCFHSL